MKFKYFYLKYLLHISKYFKYVQFLMEVIALLLQGISLVITISNIIIDKIKTRYNIVLNSQ